MQQQIDLSQNLVVNGLIGINDIRVMNRLNMNNDVKNIVSRLQQSQPTSDSNSIERLDQGSSRHSNNGKPMSILTIDPIKLSPRVASQVGTSRLEASFR